jgi:hypothetical protein
MMQRTFLTALGTVALAGAAGGLAGPEPALARGADSVAAAKKPGTVVAAARLRRGLWIPGTTARAFKLKYVTTDARGKRALSTGTVFVPKGHPPRGGWLVISWAHGTSGLGDRCAPS